MKNELDETKRNLIAIGNQIESEEAVDRQLLTDATNALGTQMVDDQNATNRLLTDATNALGTQMVDDQNATSQLFNALRRAITDQQSFNQYMIENGLDAFQNMFGSMYQAYQQLANQPIIYLTDRRPEPVNTSGMTPQIAESVNRAATLIGEQEDIEEDDVRDDFITFASLLHRNMDNEYFVNFTNRIGFGRLFRSYLSRHTDKELMDFFVRVANRIGLTSGYLNDVDYYIKRRDVVVDPNYDEYLVRTYNTIAEMFNTNNVNKIIHFHFTSRAK